MQFYTTREIADILKVNETSVTGWIRDGLLTGIKIGTIWRIRDSDFEEFINMHEVKRKPHAGTELSASPDSGDSPGLSFSRIITSRSGNEFASYWQKYLDSLTLPQPVENILYASGFSNLKPEYMEPGYKTKLSGGRQPSTGDLYIRLNAVESGEDRLVVIMVEGIKEETFGQTLEDRINFTLAQIQGDYIPGSNKSTKGLKAEYGKNTIEEKIKMIEDKSNSGMPERTKWLMDILKTDPAKAASVPYRLIHRTASAVIEAGEAAQKGNKNQATTILLAHSFSNREDQPGFSDFRKLLNLLGVIKDRETLETGKLTPPITKTYPNPTTGVELRFGWMS